MNRHQRFAMLVMVAAVSVPVAQATAGKGETPEGGGTAGPDLIVGSLPNVHHWTTSGPIDGMQAYTVGSTVCNIGTEQVDWFAPPDPHHVTHAQSIYRFANGRFEHLGLSWVRHHVCALQQSLCGACQPAGGCCCSQLGVGCSTVNSTSGNGAFINLGPRSEINAHLGSNLGTHQTPPGDNALSGRVQVRQDDLDPALNPGAKYYAEVQYVARDDAGYGDMTNDNNNASYRQVTVNPSTFFLNTTGPTIREQAAIHAWQANDAAVTITDIDVPGEGRFALGHRVTALGGGMWHYEYALYNMNSHRSARSFSVPIPAGVTPSGIGFHDVDYHSGEPYSLDDWTTALDDGRLTWTTEPFAQNENANALRWGTLYNFRFDADAPPRTTVSVIELFRPGTPASVTVETLGPAILGDFDGDGDVDIDDFAAFVACVDGPDVPIVGQECVAADLDFDGDADLGDAGAFQRAFTGR